MLQSTAVSYKIHDIDRDTDVGVKVVFDYIIDIFSVNDDSNINDILSKWIDMKIIELNKKLDESK